MVFTSNDNNDSELYFVVDQSELTDELEGTSRQEAEQMLSVDRNVDSLVVIKGRIVRRRFVLD